MPSINMIAPRRAERKRLESNVVRLLVVILVEVVAIVGISGLLLTRVYGTRVTITEKQVKLEELRPTVNKIEFYDKATKDLKPKLDTLNQANSETSRWCRVLDQVSISLPEKTWLTRLGTDPIQPAAAELCVKLNGISANQELIGDTMLRMHDTVSDFSRVDLHYTQKAVVGGLTAVEFELAGAIKLADKTGKEEVAKS